MKRLYRILVLFLALVLLAAGAASADGTFIFRNGVTWDTTYEQMLTAEGLNQSGYNEHKDNEYTFYYLIGQDVYYVYRNVSGTELLVQAYSVLPGAAYAAELETRTSQYGAPAGVTADTVAALINTIQGSGTVAPEELTNLAAWRLNDGTLAALFKIGGAAYMAYFHEQRILGG